MMKYFILITTTLTLAACNSGRPTYITADSTPNPIISVSATGTTHTAPDTASVSAGVVTEGQNAGDAMRANAEKMNRVFSALKTAGILDKNIQTSQLSLQPRYDYSDRKAPRITSYEARNTVSAKTEDLATVGAMLDALVSAGVNTINGVQFSVKDPKQARMSARTEAITLARDKAQSMAEAAGVTLGPLQSLNESSGGYAPQPMMMARAQSDAYSAPTPISAGEQTLSVTVNMTYAIKP